MLKNVERMETIRRVLPVSVQNPVKKAIRRYRSLTGHLRLLPDYLVIGARRCGTTALYNYLIQHPCVLPALTKEVSYFDAWFDRGDSWYRSHFPLALEKWFSEMRYGRQVLTGEASPSYLLDPLVPSRVQSLLPSVKLIVALRNPIDAI